MAAQQGQSGQLEFLVEKTNVERCIMDNQFRAADKLKQRRCNLGKFRLVLQAFQRQAMYLGCACINFSLRIQVTVKTPLGNFSMCCRKRKDDCSSRPMLCAR